VQRRCETERKTSHIKAPKVRLDELGKRRLELSDAAEIPQTELLGSCARTFHHNVVADE